MAIAYSITVCLLLLTWTAVVSSSLSRGCRRQIRRCGAQSQRLFTGHEVRTMPDSRRAILEIGLDQICSIVGEAFDCTESVLANPTCNADQDEREFLRLFRQMFDYMCSQDGKRLLLASFESLCFTSETFANVYMQNSRTCFRTIQSQIKSADVMPSNICHLLPVLADCVVDAARATCGADYGQLLGGLQPHGIALARLLLHCRPNAQDNRTFRNLVSRALRGFE